MKRLALGLIALMMWTAPAWAMTDGDRAVVDAVGAVHADLQNLEDLTVLSERLATLSTAITDFDTTGLGAKVDALNITDGTLNTTLGTVNTSLGTLHTDVGTTLHGDFGTLHTDLATTLHGDIATTLHGDLGTLHSDLGAVSVSVDALNISAGTLNTSIGTLKTSADTLSIAVDALTAAMHPHTAAVTASIEAEDTYSAAFTAKPGAFAITVDGTAWAGTTITLQRSLDGVTWRDFASYTTNQIGVPIIDPVGVKWRLGAKTGEYTLGPVAVEIVQ